MLLIIYIINVIILLPFSFVPHYDPKKKSDRSEFKILILMMYSVSVALITKLTLEVQLSLIIANL